MASRSNTIVRDIVAEDFPPGAVQPQGVAQQPVAAVGVPPLKGSVEHEKSEAEKGGAEVMRPNWTIGTVMASAITTAGLSVLLAGSAFAHCDTIGGPIIPEARAALEKGDVTPILKWIQKDDEAEIKAAFAKAVAVRAKGAEAQELADQFFLETLVRLHRAGEGAPYSGIKDEPVEPIVAMADKALAAGSADAMVEALSGHMAAAVRERFEKAVEAKKNKDKSVETGRDFVEAYVIYMHFVEGIHSAIMSTGAHHSDAGAGTPAHRD